MKKFEVGKTYYSRFIGDSNLHISYTVVKRSEKFITFVNERGNQLRMGLDKYYLEQGKEVCGKHGEFIHA